MARLLLPEDPGAQRGHGAPLVVLWLLLAAGWLAWRIKRGNLSLRWVLPDTLVLALVAWHSLSGLAAFFRGAPRPALNALWDWIAIATAYFLARQLIHTPRTARAVAATMISVAVGLALVGIHQRFVEIPANQAAYEQTKHDMLELYRQTGQWMPAGSSLREQFENRLYTNQPTATFALTNSLAGFLVPWLCLTALVLPQLWKTTGADDSAASGTLRQNLWILAGTGLAGVELAGLLLTGSRSALLAVVFSGLLLVVYRTASRWSSWRRGQQIGFAAVTVIGIVAVVFVGHSLWESAYRSLSYRFEYWQATATMIRDWSLLGCGPGQFQDSYTLYKLPTASEEIQDPHNWLLEVWATAGTPAMLLLVAFFVVVGRRILTADVPPPVPEATSPGGSTIVAGAVVGVVLGTALGWTVGFPISRAALLLLLVGVAVTWLVLLGWVRAGELSPWQTFLAGVALLVNLLAAGGIGYPGIADSLWLLMAMTINLSERPVAAASLSEVRSTKKLTAWGAGLALAVLLAAAMATLYQPVMNSRLALSRADAALAMDDMPARRTALVAAVEADPWSAQAAQQLAAQRLVDYQQQPQESVLRLFQQANRRMLELAPGRSSVWAQSAEYHRAIYEQTQRVEYLHTAIDHALEAIARYPHRAILHALAAQLWDEAGDTAKARRYAQRAVQLDDQMRAAGHHDRLLPAATYAAVRRIATSN